MKLAVQPIVRQLDLAQYHAAYADQGAVVWVWVNAPTAFLRQRDELLIEYSRRWGELQRLRIQAVEDVGSRFVLRKLFPPKRAAGAPDADQIQIDRFNEWVGGTFLPRLHAWFANLLSKGPDDTHWTAEELDRIFQEDSTLLEWIKRKALGLVQAYAEEKKRD